MSDKEISKYRKVSENGLHAFTADESVKVWSYG